MTNQPENNQNTSGKSSWLKASNFLTGADDPTVGRVSVLSRPAEWHAVMVGVLAVIAPDVLAASGLPPGVASALGPGFAASYVAGRGMKDLARLAADGMSVGHVRDALAEPAYTSTGYVLGLGLVEVLVAF